MVVVETCWAMAVLKHSMKLDLSVWNKPINYWILNSNMFSPLFDISSTLVQIFNTTL